MTRVPLEWQFLQKGIIGSSEKLVEDVEVALAFSLEHYAWLLQQVVDDVATGRVALHENSNVKITLKKLLSFLFFDLKLVFSPYGEIELDVHVFAESWRVVVAIGFSVTEGLQYRVGLQQFVFDRFQIRLLARRGGDELQHFFRGLRLARSGFTWWRPWPKDQVNKIKIFRKMNLGITNTWNEDALVNQLSA